MALAPGTRLGHYDVTSLLGEGGMGQVWQATDTQLNRQVALKILPDAFADDPDRLARFTREAQILASLNHPNIAAIYGIEEAEGTRALVLELVEGPTLADRIAQGAIPIEDALPIARQIAEALEAAHEAGVIHRDLKPANIKVREDGTVKVLDFGLAKAFQADPSNATTVTTAGTEAGAILGTIGYMSPEQTRGKPVDKRADVWAFGCVLYEILTGQKAFAGETRSDTVAAVLERTPSWQALPVTTPSNLQRLLRRCLEKNPRDRIRDIGDARLEFDDLTPNVDPSTAVTPGHSASSRLTLRVSLAALAVVALVAATLLSPWRAQLGAPITSLAVLPFEWLDAAGDDDYLGIGIAADIITRVSQIRELTVRPTTAVRGYAGRDTPPLDAGRELAVEGVLEGTLQHQYDRIRVNVNLLAVQDGSSIWTDTFDVASGDLLV